MILQVHGCMRGAAMDLNSVRSIRGRPANPGNEALKGFKGLFKGPHRPGRPWDRFGSLRPPETRSQRRP